MKRSKFTEAQIGFALRQAEDGVDRIGEQRQNPRPITGASVRVQPTSDQVTQMFTH